MSGSAMFGIDRGRPTGPQAGDPPPSYHDLWKPLDDTIHDHVFKHYVDMVDEIISARTYKLRCPIQELIQAGESALNNAIKLNNK
ncbi:hypothetical protein LTR27_009222 [Elasticomyces elasticus]|nr:hypothetical protein LTR27_009222 [Elasticomyces elasticus]